MSQVESYLKARAAYLAIKQEVTRLAAMFERFSKDISSKPENLIFSNARTGRNNMAALSSNSPSFDANKWPTPDEIHALLDQMSDHRRTMETIWEALPRDVQAGLQSPPTQSIVR